MEIRIGEEKGGRDWRILLGLAITFGWLLAGAIYIAANVGWNNFGSLPIDEMGTFLEGAFAPLAFLWLVIGLFIQQSILAENNRELRRNNLQSEKQTQAIAATELNARQETFFKISESTRKQLGGISGMLYISSQSTAGNGTHTMEEINEFWKQFASGDVEVFSRRFLTLPAMTEETVDYKDLFFGTEIRRRHADNFIVAFDRLLKLARECDYDNIIQDALIYSAHGLVNQRMRDLHPEIRFSPLHATNAKAYLQQVINSEAMGSQSG